MQNTSSSIVHRGIPLAIAAILLAVYAIPVSAQTQTGSQQSSTKNTLIVFDASGSMSELFDGTTRLSAAKGAVFDFLDAQSTDVGLRMYAHVNHSGDKASACTETERVYDFTQAHERIKGYIEGVQAVGSYTPTAYTLEQSVSDFNADMDNTLILLTDGKETCDGDPAAAAQALKDSGVNVVTHVIGLGVDAETRSELEGIAAAGGGDYYDAVDAASLRESFATIDEGVNKEKIQRQTTPVRGGNEIATAVPLTEGEYTLDHHQRPDEYDYFYLDLDPGDTYYISVEYILDTDNLRYSEDTDTFASVNYEYISSGDAYLEFLNHDGEKELSSVNINSSALQEESDYAVFTYNGGTEVEMLDSRDSTRTLKAHPLVGDFDRLYFKVGSFETVHKDVPFTIKKMESASNGADSSGDTNSAGANDQATGPAEGVGARDDGRPNASGEESVDENGASADSRDAGSTRFLETWQIVAIVILLFGFIGGIIYLIVHNFGRQKPMTEPAHIPSAAPPSAHQPSVTPQPGSVQPPHVPPEPAQQLAPPPPDHQNAEPHTPPRPPSANEPPPAS